MTALAYHLLRSPRPKVAVGWDEPGNSPPDQGFTCPPSCRPNLPPGALPGVGFWASLAVREACLRETGVALDLKWPNDLLWDGRKCVGILSQGRSNGQASRVVVGVGINVNRPEQVAPRARARRCLVVGGWRLRNSTGPTILATLLSIYERDFDRLHERTREGHRGLGFGCESRRQARFSQGNGWKPAPRGSGASDRR